MMHGQKQIKFISEILQGVCCSRQFGYHCDNCSKMSPASSLLPSNFIKAIPLCNKSIYWLISVLHNNSLILEDGTCLTSYKLYQSHPVVNCCVRRKQVNILPPSVDHFLPYISDIPIFEYHFSVTSALNITCIKVAPLSQVRHHSLCT
jgi:hypothetical protein